MDSKNKIKIFSRFLLSCSGVSIEIIEKCPRFEITKYTSIGLTICFTGILAFISSFFAFSLIFTNIYLIIGASIFWASIIFNLDRYIISSMRISKSKSSEIIKAVPRLIIAFLIAVIISKPLEIQIFKKEIETYLTQENLQRVKDVEKKYAQNLETLSNEKKIIEERYNKLLSYREKYYEEFKCECDGTCGTGRKGRGIECFSKKEKYEFFIEELELEKLRRDSILSYLAKRELKFFSSIEKDKEIISASINIGLIDQIRALNNVDKLSSLFIIFIFVMIETAPILTKLMSSKGPYDNLILEYERQFEINYLKALDDFDHERLKNQKLKEMSTRYEIKSKEAQIQSIVKDETLKRYEGIRNQLEDKIAKNN